MSNRIVEPLIVIGRDEEGKVGMEMNPAMNPASAVVLLEQSKARLVAGFRFERKSLVEPAPAMQGLTREAR